MIIDKAKVLFIITSLAGGGAEKVLMTVLHHFDYEKYDVTLCVVSKSGIYLNELPQSLKKIYVYENPNSFVARLGFVLYSRLRLSFVERFSMRRKIAENYDTIVSFCEGRSMKFHGYVMDKGKRNVTWVHCNLFAMHYTVGPVLSSKDEKRLYESMDEVVFVSNAAREEFGKLNYHPKHTAVVYNPIEIDSIQRYLKKKVTTQESCRIVLCGRLVKEKAFERMVRVAGLLSQAGYDYTVEILGEGEDRQKLEKLISQLFLEDKVILRGFVKPPYPNMADADIFVSTSKTEGYPVNICEAMSLALPIVATRCSGNAEIIGEDEQCGVLTDQDDQSIYDGIVKMIESPELRERCGKNAYEKSKSFDADEVMKSVYSVI